MPLKLLIPVDSARNSRTAEEYAVKLHKVAPVQVVLLNVVDPRELDGHGIDPGLKETIMEKKRMFAEKAVAEAAEIFKKAGIEYKRTIATGEPSSLICSAAHNEDIDIVLLADHRRSERQGGYMGRVTNYVLHRCEIPVLLVKTPR